MKKLLKKTRLYKMYNNTNKVYELKEENVNLNNRINDLEEKILRLEKLSEKTYKISKETLFADMFHDTINNSEWFNIPLSLCSWAIGYNYAYLLFRVLNEVKPKNILEAGLGQSTKIITEYVKKFENVNHDIVEHNSSWIDFFKNHTDMSNMQNIHLLEMIEKEKNGFKYNCYKNFKKEFKNKKYNLISIDGPIGGGNHFSRIDILDLIPECLDDTFVIMLDDSEREGEQNMIQLLEEKLRKNGVKYCSGTYEGECDLYICTSEDISFLCHL